MPAPEIIMGSFAMFLAVLAGAPGDAPHWIAEGPYLENDKVSLELPLEMLGNMPIVAVSINGEAHRFLFDTGSPSMIGRELATRLGLEIVDRRQGRDGSGAIIDTAVVQADFTIAGTTFHKVPVFVTDFPKPPSCLFEGVLGSEVLPLCSWQIDLPEGVLRCESDITQLEHVDSADREVLHSFGYPHTPFLDVQFAPDARSKAMLDTGSQEYFTLSPPDFEGARRNNAVEGTTQGQGSMGGSVGGAAPAREQLRVHLASLSIGDNKLGRITTPLRTSPPSLIGASILEHFVVTLDTRNTTAWFDRYNHSPLAQGSYGFGLGFDDKVRVSHVWNDSPAAKAGIDVGDHVEAINGQATGNSCPAIRHALSAMKESNTITLEIEGEPEPRVLQKAPMKYFIKSSFSCFQGQEIAADSRCGKRVREGLRQRCW